MLASTLFSTLATASTVSAAKAYMAYAWNNTAPEIHGMALQARAGNFYLGGDAYPVCEDDDFDCLVHNKTLITGPLPSKYSDNFDGFFMHITDDQPQEMITSHDGPDLRYTLPKTDLATVLGDKYFGAVNTPFSVDFDDFSNQTVLRFNGNDFAACYTTYNFWGHQPYVVYALSYGDKVYRENLGCTPFKMRLVETDLRAPAYYKYPCLSAPPAEGVTCVDTLPQNSCFDSPDSAYCSDADKKAWAIKDTPKGYQCHCEGDTGYGV